MLDVTWTVTLKLQGPVLTRSSTPLIPGISAPAAKYGDKYILPDTLVRGTLLHAWGQLAAVPGSGFADPSGKLLGGARGSGDKTPSGGEPARGRLWIGDFGADGIAGRRLSRIEIDDDLGSVKSGHLRIADAPFLPGDEACFVGKIELFARDDEDANDVLFHLRAGLGWICAFGSEKTVGFGRMLGFEISDDRKLVNVSETVAAGTGSATAVLPLCITFDAPVCFPRAQPIGNLFESSDEVPGAALKGALATTLNLLAGRPAGTAIGEDTAKAVPRWADLARHISSIRFTNAFPAVTTKDGPAPPRPVRPPLSLVKWKDDENTEQLADAAHADGPFLLNGMAPAFAVDWKDDSDVAKAYGWHRPVRELRVHTAISPKTGAVAVTADKDEEEGALFGLEMLRPEGVTWRANVCLSGVPLPPELRAPIATQLRDLLTTIGLRRVGKTDARATVSIPESDPGNAVNSKEATGEGGLFFVTLQTDALLGKSSGLPEGAGAAELRTFYKDAWTEISDRKLRLVRFFARQRLLGGNYLWKRFRPREAYSPHLLTVAGSVFVLEATGTAEEAREKVAEWLRKGLPLPKYLAGGAPTWKTCPFVPENGWGEIAVDLPDHRENDATKQAKKFSPVGFQEVWKEAAGPEGGAA